MSGVSDIYDFGVGDLLELLALEGYALRIVSPLPPDPAERGEARSLPLESAAPAGKWDHLGISP